MKLVTPLLMLCCALCVVYATSKPTKKDRVHHEKPLSSHEHNDEDHEYDHDAFLGEEEAKTFDQLPPEESKRRLGILVERIDEDKDGYVTEQELNDWIKKAQKKYIYDNVARQWADYDTNSDDNISWEEYKNVTYGTYLENPTEEEGYDYKRYMARDEKRFKVADRNGDNIADREEFTTFLHPEDFDHMKDTVVQETMEDLDKNQDGFIDMKEYISDMYKEDEEDHGEPAWVTEEREQFNQFRDKDNDGKMDMAEVKDWILPNNYDHALSEAKHLVSESDLNKDGKLTKKEILNKFDLFVGSQATDFGEALNKHDEF